MKTKEINDDMPKILLGDSACHQLLILSERKILLRRLAMLQHSDIMLVDALYCECAYKCNRKDVTEITCCEAFYVLLNCHNWIIYTNFCLGDAH